MEHVLWLGGGCGSGKSTIARTLAHRLDLQLYPVDAHGWRHHRLLGAGEQRSNDEMWLRPAPEELAERFVRSAEEHLSLILDDLDAMRGGPLVLAEGPLLFPALVGPHIASSADGVWLVPTEEFQEWCLRKRGGMDSSTSNPERALRNRLGRDAILNRLNRRQAAELGFTVIEVDGSRTLPEMEEVVAAHFAERIAAGRGHAMASSDGVSAGPRTRRCTPISPPSWRPRRSPSRGPSPSSASAPRSAATRGCRPRSTSTGGCWSVPPGTLSPNRTGWRL